MPSPKIRRIGLISPCSGNLGNAAIMSSMIVNIGKRIPDAEIIGITLSPEDTRRRHGIETFPITYAYHQNYSLSRAHSSLAVSQTPSWWLRLRGWLKQVPVLRQLVRASRLFWMEASHILAASRQIRKLDCVIITGGGALDEFWGGPWGHPWTLFKFAVLSRLFGVPFLMVSIGKCSLERPLSRFFARSALRLARYRSYRDHDSKDAVQSLLPLPADPVCPDLAYSYVCSQLPRRRHISPQARLVVGVSPIAYCDPRVWPLKDEKRYRRYLRELAAMLQWLVGQNDHVIFFATDAPDLETIRDLQSMNSDVFTENTSVEVLPGPPEQTTEGLLQRLSAADLVIASRLHGVILSHLIAIPVLAISYDRKVDVHMNEIGQAQYCVNIDSVAASTLIERFRALTNARERESANLERAVRVYRQQVDAQYDRILGSIQPCGSEENKSQLVSSLE